MRIFIISMSLIILSTISFAETIKLKSGKVIEGKIIERTADSIKVDTGAGVNLTYFLDDLEQKRNIDVQSAGNTGMMQKMPAEKNNDGVNWAGDVDLNTEWGKWLLNTVKPYWDKMDEAERVYKMQKSGIDPNLSGEEAANKYKEIGTDYSNTVSDINKSYNIYEILSGNYELIMAEFADIIKDKKYENQMNVIYKNMDDEIEAIFQKHGVPQNIIKKFKRIH